MTCRFLTLGLAALMLASLSAGASTQRPNVILIMADDLGYNDLSCYGSTQLETPVLDKMAAEGMRLTSYYCGNTVCTPSRMALLTGAYPRRLGWKGGVVGYGVATQNGLAPEALTIAEIFKDAGYKTGLCGKWHLGDSAAHTPMEQGFESAYYINKSNNQTKQLWRGTELIADPFENRQLTAQFTQEAIKFIRANRAHPFFLYLPFTAPHFPAEPHPDWKGKSVQGAYGDVVQELDSRIGQILEALKETQLDEKTIVVFISDNGVEPSQKKWARAKPYRGLKWSALEGGNRVPGIIRWPGVIPAGQVSAKITAAIDLLPTLTAACGIDAAKVSKGSPKIDGKNVWDTLIGKGTAHPRNDLLYFHGWGVLQAVRVAEWKLYVDKVKEIPGSDKGPVLFNLSQDPGESRDVSEQHPERVAAMRALAMRQLSDIEAHQLPLGGPPPKPNKRHRQGALWLVE